MRYILVVTDLYETRKLQPETSVTLSTSLGKPTINQYNIYGVIVLSFFRLTTTWSTFWRHRMYRICRHGYPPSNHACVPSLIPWNSHPCKSRRPPFSQICLDSNGKVAEIFLLAESSSHRKQQDTLSVSLS